MILVMMLIADDVPWKGHPRVHSWRQMWQGERLLHQVVLNAFEDPLTTNLGEKTSLVPYIFSLCNISILTSNFRFRPQFH
jgi:hypothetical protein